MPVFKSGKGRAPDWCEMEFFEIAELREGSTHHFERVSPKEKLIVGKGRCRVAFGGETVDADEGANLDLVSPESWFEVVGVSEACTLIRMCGQWGEEVGGSGIFRGTRSDSPQDGGGQVAYAKETNFDNHFHDCDEYWILFEGSGVAVSEGKHYEVGPGDCVATGMGHHHDFPIVHQPVSAVYFETTMTGPKRRGHLWEHTHGKAEPRPERV